MEDSTELKAQRPFHQEFTKELWKVNDPKLRHLGIRWIKEKERKEKKKKIVNPNKMLVVVMQFGKLLTEHVVLLFH